LDEFDIIRLEKLKKQVEEALSNYEFNLFDASEFSKIKETEQVDYLFGVIDQMS
jgi:hypothetical protein